MLFSSPRYRHLSLVFVLIYCLFPSLSFAQEDIVSVRLLSDAAPRTIVISSTHPLQLYSGIDTNPILELEPREKLTLTTRTDRVYLSSSSGGIYATSLFVATPEGDKSSEEEPVITVEIPDSRSLTSPRSYHGSLKIDVEENPNPMLRLVNYVPLENYVASVLASEFGYEALEGAKAMALCIRTLTLRHLTNQSGPEYAVPDNESWQAYKGTGPITSTAVEATRATMGQVLLYDNQLIEAVYFASSGGFTANNEDVWNASEIVPYLRGREDEYDFNSPHHVWQRSISRSDLHAHLSNKYDIAVNGISIHDTNRRDQRARSIKLSSAGDEQVIIPGNEFRLVVNHRFGRDAIKSTMFKINTQPGSYLFSGGGFGHGVGLNQEGALELSKRDWTHEEILNYYYGDIVIDSYLPAMALPPEAAISSNVPSIDMSAPPPLDAEPFSNTFTSEDSFVSDNSEATSYSSSISNLLYGDGDSETEEVETSTIDELSGMDSQTATKRGRKKKKNRIHMPEKIVGWTTTTEATAASDSTQTKPKKRTTGW